MMDRKQIDEAWQNLTVFEAQPPGRCPPAEAFAAWAMALIEQTRQQPALATIHAALLHLQERFWEYHRDLPKAHRQRMGKPNHICVFQVYEESYAALRQLQLALLPAPASPQPSPQLAGARWVFIGEPVTETNE